MASHQSHEGSHVRQRKPRGGGRGNSSGKKNQSNDDELIVTTPVPASYKLAGDSPHEVTTPPSSGSGSQRSSTRQRAHDLLASTPRLARSASRAGFQAAYHTTRRAFFCLGLLFGVAIFTIMLLLVPLTAFSPQTHGALPHTNLTKLLSEAEQFFWSGVEYTNLTKLLSEAEQALVVENAPRTRNSLGARLRGAGYRPKHPVVLIPGFTSIHLEVWSSRRPCGGFFVGDGGGSLKASDVSSETTSEANGGASSAGSETTTPPGGWFGSSYYRFRQRLWGSGEMAKSFLLNRRCWAEHMALSPYTGLDPFVAVDNNGTITPETTVRVRASNSLDGIKEFVPGYVLWEPLVEALADFGLDRSSIHEANFDWRLAPYETEIRDGYFTRLKNRIEELCTSMPSPDDGMSTTLVNVTAESPPPKYFAKAVVFSHSYGDNVFRVFLDWADAREPGWVERHIESYVNIAGPSLGLPKALQGLVSGEFRESAQIANMFGALGPLISESIMPARERAAMWRTWGSLLAMQPYGGDGVWGTPEGAPDDDGSATEAASATAAAASIASENGEGSSLFAWPSGVGSGLASKAMPPLARSFGAMLAATGGVDSGNCSLGYASCASSDGIRALKSHLESLPDPWRQIGRRLATESASPTSSKRLGAPARWYTGHALHVPLPRAPSLKVACAYGIGIEAERSYYLRGSADVHADASSSASQSSNYSSHGDCTGLACVQMDPITSDPPKLPAHLSMDISHNSAPPAPVPGASYARKSRLSQGIQYTDGDGTVPLLSLGGACARAWQPADPGKPATELNPSGVKVALREYEHNGPDDESLSGDASDHVSILVNRRLHKDLLLVAAGVPMSSRVVSNIHEQSKRARALNGDLVHVRF
ncbi:phospholipid:diacylglycerol acyltransferase [Pycnococcus provasolii]